MCERIEKSLVVVVLYNKDINDSLTIKSINESFLSNATLHIINNGPKELFIKDECVEFLSRDNNTALLFNFIYNKPLSAIYNESLSTPGYDKYIFFDDDSSFEPDYFCRIDRGQYETVDLQIPMVIDKITGCVSYPKTTVLNFTIHEGLVVPQDKYIYSIGSGLIVYACLIEKFKKSSLDLFDERYALYGVDLSLFRRIGHIKKRNECINIVVSGSITHSLSSTSEKMTDWRYRERLYDKILSIRFYSKSKLRLLLGLINALSAEILRFKFKNIFVIFCVFFRGKHPRC